MQEYVIAMKSGHSFRVRIKDFVKFTGDLVKVVEGTSSPNVFYSQGGVMFNLSEVSAVYPVLAEHSGEEWSSK